MICLLCRTAADQRAPKEQHCTDPKCMCGHRTDRYRPLDGIAAVADFFDQFNRVTAEARAREERYRRALPARMTEIASDLTGLLPDEARAAGIHFALEPTTED